MLMAMRQNLWAPWRIDYLRGMNEAEPLPDFIAEAWAHPDRDPQNLVLYRDDFGLIMLNRFPYTNGHLLVAPGRAVADLKDLNRDERAALMDLVVLAEKVIDEALNPQGMNVGWNMGRCAGAALPGHLHAHLVPRWGGDVNFMETIGAVQIIPQALEAVYEEMLEALERVRS